MSDCRGWLQLPNLVGGMQKSPASEEPDRTRLVNTQGWTQGLICRSGPSDIMVGPGTTPQGCGSQGPGTTPQGPGLQGPGTTPQ
ncbi:hypothetical protein HaLaN_30614, partial [Haematococcus lacustris]